MIAVTLSGFPDLIEEAQRWITHLGNFGAPLTGVVLADYLVVKRQRLDVEALFDPQGRYRYLNGVNVAAVLAVAAGVGLLLRSCRFLAQGRRRRGRGRRIVPRPRGDAGSSAKIRGDH